MPDARIERRAECEENRQRGDGRRVHRTDLMLSSFCSSAGAASPPTGGRSPSPRKFVQGPPVQGLLSLFEPLSLSSNRGRNSTHETGAISRLGGNDRTDRRGTAAARARRCSAVSSPPGHCPSACRNANPH